MPKNDTGIMIFHITASSYHACFFSKDLTLIQPRAFERDLNPKTQRYGLTSYKKTSLHRLFATTNEECSNGSSNRERSESSNSSQSEEDDDSMMDWEEKKPEPTTTAGKKPGMKRKKT